MAILTATREDPNSRSITIHLGSKASKNKEKEKAKEQEKEKESMAVNNFLAASAHDVDDAHPDSAPPRSSLPYEYSGGAPGFVQIGGVGTFASPSRPKPGSAPKGISGGKSPGGKTRKESHSRSGKKTAHKVQEVGGKDGRTPIMSTYGVDTFHPALNGSGPPGASGSSGVGSGPDLMTGLPMGHYSNHSASSSSLFLSSVGASSSGGGGLSNSVISGASISSSAPSSASLSSSNIPETFLNILPPGFADDSSQIAELIDPDVMDIVQNVGNKSQQDQDLLKNWGLASFTTGDFLPSSNVPGLGGFGGTMTPPPGMGRFESEGGKSLAVETLDSDAETGPGNPSFGPGQGHGRNDSTSSNAGSVLSGRKAPDRSHTMPITSALMARSTSALSTASSTASSLVNAPNEPQAPILRNAASVSSLKSAYPGHLSRPPASPSTTVATTLSSSNANTNTYTTPSTSVVASAASSRKARSSASSSLMTGQLYESHSQHSEILANPPNQSAGGATSSSGDGKTTEEQQQQEIQALRSQIKKLQSEMRGMGSQQQQMMMMQVQGFGASGIATNYASNRRSGSVGRKSKNRIFRNKKRPVTPNKNEDPTSPTRYSTNNPLKSVNGGNARASDAGLAPGGAGEWEEEEDGTIVAWGAPGNAKGKGKGLKTGENADAGFDLARDVAALLAEIRTARETGAAKQPKQSNSSSSSKRKARLDRGQVERLESMVIDLRSRARKYSTNLKDAAEHFGEGGDDASRTLAAQINSKLDLAEGDLVDHFDEMLGQIELLREQAGLDPKDTLLNRNKASSLKEQSSIGRSRSNSDSSKTSVPEFEWINNGLNQSQEKLVALVEEVETLRTLISQSDENVRLLLSALQTQASQSPPQGQLPPQDEPPHLPPRTPSNRGQDRANRPHTASPAIPAAVPVPPPRRHESPSLRVRTGHSSEEDLSSLSTPAAAAPATTPQRTHFRTSSASNLQPLHTSIPQVRDVISPDRDEEGGTLPPPYTPAAPARRRALSETRDDSQLGSRLGVAPAISRNGGPASAQPRPLNRALFEMGTGAEQEVLGGGVASPGSTPSHSGVASPNAQAHRGLPGSPASQMGRQLPSARHSEDLQRPPARGTSDDTDSRRATPFRRRPTPGVPQDNTSHGYVSQPMDSRSASTESLVAPAMSRSSSNNSLTGIRGSPSMSTTVSNSGAPLPGTRLACLCAGVDIEMVMLVEEEADAVRWIRDSVHAAAAHAPPGAAWNPTSGSKLYFGTSTSHFAVALSIPRDPQSTTKPEDDWFRTFLNIGGSSTLSNPDLDRRNRGLKAWRKKGGLVVLAKTLGEAPMIQLVRSLSKWGITDDAQGFRTPDTDYVVVGRVLNWPVVERLGKAAANTQYSRDNFAPATLKWK